MTTQCPKLCKNRSRETLESGVASKLQRPIVSQPKLLIVIYLFTSRFMANDYDTLLGYCRFFVVLKTL